MRKKYIHHAGGLIKSHTMRKSLVTISMFVKVQWKYIGLRIKQCAQFKPWQGSFSIVFLGKHSTLTVPLSAQVYKWVSANLMLGLPCNRLASHQGPSTYRNTPSHFMLQKLEISTGLMGHCPDWNADFTPHFVMHDY